MNIISRYIDRALAALLFCAVTASCSEDMFAPGENGELPPGSHPLELVASIEGLASRAANEYSWTDGDSILVKIGAYPDSCRYKLNADGTVMSAEKVLEWTQPEANVTGWYPAHPLPSVADQSEGLHRYDHMIAIAENQYYKDVVDLTFRHQMAKITCTLV